MPFVKVNGIEIYYEISGSGPPLTLIMGLTCCVQHWQWMVPVFAESFKVITFDNRGVGRSGKPDMDYTTELFADDIRALLNALNITKTHLFGVSVGGMVAQAFALKYPQMLNRLVLGCTMPSFTHHPPAPEDLLSMQETTMLTPEESAETMMRLYLTEQFFVDNPDKVAKLKEVILLERKQQGPDAFLLQIGAAMNHDTVNEVKNIKAPTLVITGDNDPISPVENARSLADQIPDSTLAEMPGVRHAFWVERFEEACGTIINFLS
jgi:pimeloyl-ACP methyl ester carboxylesterase